MAPAGFEPAIPASDRPQTYALESAATGIGCYVEHAKKFCGQNAEFLSDT
jgi:hypothetical protein